MGYSNWSQKAYQSRQTTRKRNKQTAFPYDKQVRQSGQRRVHPEMNVLGKTRESRDSATHPDSLSIAVLFDVTGSMGRVPRVLQTKLGSLMRMLIQKGYVSHPQILFGAIGDAYTDRVPLQIGQFESGLEMDDDLGKIFLEGAGGGQGHETYELGLYYMARHTEIDCLSKRGKKGYLFTIGDERYYDIVRRDHIQKYIDPYAEADVPSPQIFQEVMERYEYFHIVPTNTSHGKREHYHAKWRTLLEERVLILDDEAAVCETIALAIGLCEGMVDDLYSGTDELVDAGYDQNSAESASTALQPFARTHAPALQVVNGNLPLRSSTLDDGRL